jgi:hypothetical protein
MRPSTRRSSLEPDKITVKGTSACGLRVACWRKRRPWWRSASRRQGPKVDERWTETALEVMAGHTGESRRLRTLVIERARASVVARLRPGAVSQPSRATALRLLGELERRHRLFRLSTKRNRDIADRPKHVYGKLRPTRPGEYLLMGLLGVAVAVHPNRGMGLASLRGAIVQGSERRYAGQIARSQERLRRVAMFGEGFAEDRAGLGLRSSS